MLEKRGLVTYIGNEQIEIMSYIIDEIAIKLDIDIDKIYSSFDEKLIEQAELKANFV